MKDVNFNFYSIYVSKYSVNQEGRFERKRQNLEDFQLYSHISGVDHTNLVLHGNQINQILESEKVTIKDELSLILLIGEKMHHNVNSIARAARVLAEKRINIEMIHMNQGSSQISLLLGVKTHDEKSAVEAIQNEFFTSVSV